ncbi:hypothetical protein [Francisella salimarina]|uniref:hypothetical protein n=1 Tax=Francisella salimarina TaxID=2599927 RepID=UPI003D814BE4
MRVFESFSSKQTLSACGTMSETTDKTVFVPNFKAVTFESSGIPSINITSQRSRSTVQLSLSRLSEFDSKLSKSSD